MLIDIRGLPYSSDGKESAYNAGDPGSIPRSGKSPGEGNGNPLQYSCLDNSMDRGAWRSSPWGCKELDTTKQPTQTLPPGWAAIYWVTKELDTTW